jgi:hypothetical protein
MSATAADPLLPGRSQFGWHSGEQAVQKLVGVSTFSRQNPTSTVFPVAHGQRIAINQLLGVGALDERGRPWSSVWGGERGFARRTAEATLEIETLVDCKYDPVVRALLLSGLPAPEEAQWGRKFVSGMSMDFDSRDRVKIMGRMLTGGLLPMSSDYNKDVGEARITMLVQESTGNCPKYINKRDVYAHIPSSRLISDSLPLPQSAIDLIHKADLFFLSSTNGDSMDTNHRGGPAGFCRLASNTKEEGVVLVYPEYSGNRLYQTLGNLYLNPKIGVVIPDFDTSAALYLTGVAEILLGNAALEVMPHQKLVVRISVHEALFVADSLPFHGKLGEMSPYDPPIRALATEGALGSGTYASAATAELLRREMLTRSICRFTFALHTPSGAGNTGQEAAVVKPWLPGQHITFDFSSQLDQGYKHMDNNNPQSLNDDYIRTFTISNTLSAAQRSEETVEDGTLVQITARKHGPVTGYLWTYDLTGEAKPLTVPVMGFGGEASFWLPVTPKDVPVRPIFIAAGVGITPILAQAAGVLDAEAQYGTDTVSGLCLLWSLRADDLPLAIDTFSMIQGLASRTRLFTSHIKDSSEGSLEQVKRMGAEVVLGRLTEESVLAPSKNRVPGATKYYICTGTELSKALLSWLAGEVVISENFAY